MGLDDEPVVNVAVVLLTLIPFEAKLPRDQLIVCYGLDESFMTSFPNVGSLVFCLFAETFDQGQRITGQISRCGGAWRDVIAIVRINLI